MTYSTFHKDCDTAPPDLTDPPPLSGLFAGWRAAQYLFLTDMHLKAGFMMPLSFFDCSAVFPPKGGELSIDTDLVPSV